jgi:hypothetical protein
MSQLLRRLESQLETTSDPVFAAEIKAKRACYLARTGYFDDARAAIAELRRSFGAGESARISVLIMLAEGLAELFERVSPNAKDRIARAQLIATATRDRELGAIASAWKAHIDFETSDFDSMFRSLASAIDLAEESNHEAHSRIALTVFNCLVLYGDRRAAQSWFMKAREHALALGDQATIDALLYNRAAFGTAAIRAEKCFGEIDSDLVDLVRLEVFSAENFQTIANIRSVNHFIRLCKARILMQKDLFDEAYSLLSIARSEGPHATYNFSQGIVDLERVYCLIKIGQTTEAQALFAGVEGIEVQDFDIDDRLTIAWLKRELACFSPEYGDVSSLTAGLKTLTDAYIDHKARVNDKMSILLRSKGLM